MPFSQSSQISTIVGFIEKINPASILDVGTGMGQYGFLARNNLENVNLFKVDGAQASQKSRQEWRVRIDGIEGCRTYLTPVHEYVYNRIMIGEALDLLSKVGDNAYDLVLAVDILEHFIKPDGLKFLGELKRVTKRVVLVSTPKEFISQEIEANPYENHRSHWTDEELKQENYGEILDNSESWIAVYSKAA
jgi:2-polyprenyl-3-methyl-5-hydroxy-6-metoxy-1,4-benzoquinol methylase